MLQFEENEVIICSEVVRELDKLKKEKYNAREVFRLLENTNLEENNIKVETPSTDGYNNDYMDIRIINKAKGYGSVLVTKDRMIRVLASEENVQVEDYHNDNVDKVYNGYRTVNVSQKFIDALYNDKVIETNDDHIENEYINFKASNSSALTRYNQSELQLVENQYVHGINGKNREQIYALDALMNKDIELVTITGAAGTGKTIISLASALEQTVEIGKYNKVSVARPIAIMGDNEIGFLPGDKDEKLDLFMQPIFDSIETLYKDSNPRDVVFEYKERNLFNVESIGHIRGRSMDNQFVIVDEAQNLTPHELTTILTRIGKSTKMILTGDLNQIDKPYLDKKSNGLAYVIDKFKGEDNFAQIHLKKSERSRLAEQAVNLL